MTKRKPPAKRAAAAALAAVAAAEPATEHMQGRLRVHVNNSDVTIGPDGGVIVHGRSSVYPCEKNRAGSSEADYVPDAHQLEPGDAAVSFRRWDAEDDAVSYWPDGPNVGRPAPNYAEAMAVVAVPWPKQDVPVFRPPAVGRATNIYVAFLRSNPIPIATIEARVRSLPRAVPVPPGFDVGPLLRRHQSFSGDVRGGWDTAKLTPGLQFQGYGTYVASDLSLCMTFLCMDLPWQDKMPMAIALVQRGLDLWGSYADGRQSWMVDGGHMYGRWPLMLLTGWLLQVPQMMDPPAEIRCQFVEHHAFHPSAAGWWCGFRWSWRRHHTDREWLWKHPRDWSRDAQGTHEGETWRMLYLPDILGAHVGIVLAFRLIDRDLPFLFSYAMLSAVRDWMNPIETSVAADLRNNDCEAIAERWGKSYDFGQYSQVPAVAWRQLDARTDG